MSVDPTSPGVTRHFDVALVDRERELLALEEAWERSVRESSCQLFTVIGAAGVGKSRLVSELLTRLGDRVTVLAGRCLHYGEGITFWPVVEALSAVGARAQEVVARLGSGTAARPEELFWDVRELLGSLARERPVLLHVDDLQWGESLLLDLLEHVVELSREAPILLLCTARSGLLEYRPGWGAGRPNATTVLLDPFGPADSRALLERLGDRLDPVAQARVVTAGDGNPLFLLEMAALAQERGTVEMPPTIQALLAARIEHLDADERELLEHGAVEGEVFHRDAVEGMASERLARRLDTLLAGLVRKELIRPHPPAIHGEQAFRFRHILIRDAAYDLLAKATRAELHERFAGWLEDVASDVVEFDELAGWHQEQAVRYAGELGEQSAPGLGARAARHLHIAGHQASRRADAAGARNLLERALELASSDERPARARRDRPGRGAVDAGRAGPRRRAAHELRVRPRGRSPGRAAAARMAGEHRDDDARRDRAAAVRAPQPSSLRPAMSTASRERTCSGTASTGCAATRLRPGARHGSRRSMRSGRVTRG